MRLLRLTLPIALLALLSACVPTPAAAPTPTDAATEAPLFATDDEALAAAEEVYREYLRVSNSINDPEQVSMLDPYVSDEWFETELQSQRDFMRRGVSLSGGPEIRWLRLQEQSSNTVAMYVCLDLENARMLNRDGVDITPADRGSEGLLLVRLSETEEGTLVVDGSELWSKSCS